MGVRHTLRRNTVEVLVDRSLLRRRRLENIDHDVSVLVLALNVICKTRSKIGSGTEAENSLTGSRDRGVTEDIDTPIPPSLDHYGRFKSQWVNETDRVIPDVRVKIQSAGQADWVSV